MFSNLAKLIRYRGLIQSLVARDLKARYRAGKVGDVEVKTKLANALNAHLAPIRERRAAMLAKPEQLREILFEGSKRARGVASETLARVRDAMKISYAPR